VFVDVHFGHKGYLQFRLLGPLDSVYVSTMMKFDNKIISDATIATSVPLTCEGAQRMAIEHG